MATFDTTVNLEVFEHMERGEKTVYAVIRSDEYASICSGDRLEFGTLGAITVGAVRYYPSLEELVEAEGHTNLVPGADSAEAAVADVRRSEGWNGAKEKERGVLSLRVREARRKL